MNYVRLLTSTAAGAIAATCLAIPFPTLASVFRDGWYYSIDPSHDSIAFNFETNQLNVGNSIYEMYGMAIKENPETGEIWVAINSNLPLTGRVVPDYVNGAYVPDNNIGWGDLWFDFSGTGNFQTALDAGQMYGVRFSPNNDSGVSAGVYQAVTGASVVSENSGYWNLHSHNNEVVSHTGLNAWMGDKRWNDDYYAPYTAPGLRMPNVIAAQSQSNRVGDVTMRTEEELVAQGFSTDLFFQTASDIIAFSFTKPLGFVGDFVATILQECLNDGIALLGSFPPPPPNPDPEDECPVTFSQLEALAPDAVDGEWKIFYDTLSNQWYDPPAYMGFEFESIGGSKFKQILDFPCGIYTDDQFNVIAQKDGQSYLFQGLRPEDSLDFEDFFGESVDRFWVSGTIPNECDQSDPNLDPECPRAFSLQVRTDREISNFRIRPVKDILHLPCYNDEDCIVITKSTPEPRPFIGLLLLGLSAMSIHSRNCRH